MLIRRLFLWLYLHPKIFLILSTSVILFCRVDTIHAEEFTTITEDEITSKDSNTKIKEIVLIISIVFIAAFFIGWANGFFDESSIPKVSATKVSDTDFADLLNRYPEYKPRLEHLLEND